MSVAHAWSLMSEDERTEVEEEVRRIQSNVRMWLLRRNYRNLRTATRFLQKMIRRKLASRPGDDGAEGAEASIAAESVSDDGVGAPAPPRSGEGVVRGGGSKKFAWLRRQATAALVIQRSILHWWQRHDRDGDEPGGGTHELSGDGGLVGEGGLGDGLRREDGALRADGVDVLPTVDEGEDGEGR